MHNPAKNAWLDSNLAVQEMITSEQVYLDHLIALLNILAADGLIENIPLLKRYKIALGKLIDISERLILNAQQTRNFAHSPEQLEALRNQRAQILMAFFEVYPEVNDCYSLFSTKLNEGSTKFDDIMAYTKDNATLDLSSLLIMPIQRGMRYKLLIEATIDHNNKLSPNNPAKLNDQQIKSLRAHLTLIENSLVEANARPAPARRQRPGVMERVGSAFQSAAASVLPEDYQFGDFTRAGVNWAYPSSVTPQLENGAGADEPARDNKPASQRF